MDGLRKVNDSEAWSGDIVEPLANETQVGKIGVLDFVANVTQDFSRKLQDVERLVRMSLYKCRVVMRESAASTESRGGIAFSLDTAEI